MNFKRKVASGSLYPSEAFIWISEGKFGIKWIINQIKVYTNLIYKMSSNENVKSDFFYPSNKIAELDSVILMSKFYPWIIRYTISKGLNPDEPRYLTKVTQTF